MAQSPKSKMLSGVSAVWGTTDAGTNSNGTVLSVSRKSTAEKEAIYDENGYTQGIVFFDEKDELSLEILCKNSITIPVVGDSITIAGLTGIVTDCEVKWEQKGFKKLSITATKFANSLA